MIPRASNATTCPTDAYTTEELVRCSWWSLTEPSGARQVFVGLRDRTMTLLGATTALRGESLRMLQLSDLFVSTAFLDDMSSGRAPAVGYFLTIPLTGRADDGGCLVSRS